MIDMGSVIFFVPFESLDFFKFSVTLIFFIKIELFCTVFESFNEVCVVLLTCAAEAPPQINRDKNIPKTRIKPQ
jgi:hypothetical protein